MDLAPPLRHTVSHDIDQHAQNLTGWQQRYDQIGCGQFEGSVRELATPRLQVFCETTSHALLQSCVVKPGSIWFGLPLDGDGARINGRPAGPECLMLRPGACEFELNTPGRFQILGIVADARDLASAAQLHDAPIDWDALAASDCVQVPPTARAQAIGTVQHCLSGPGRLDADAVLAALLAMLSPCQPAARATLCFTRRQRIVAQVREFLLLHRDEVISVPELCQRMHVSRRTLQYCFEDVLGMSPISYLRAERLNGVRRQLAEGGALHRSVHDVAAAWGFRHFSQFASDYRKRFGERPSDTFKKRAQALN